jgi:hypothetical protein
MSYGIHYAVGCALDLIGFADSYWIDDGTNCKSTSGYTLSLGSGLIFSSSKEKLTIALSSAKAKYRGIFNCIIQALWIQHFIPELGIHFHYPTIIWCDNHSTLRFCRDPVQQQ